MAVHGEYISLPGLTASATLAAHQYKIVKLASTAGQVIVAAANTDKIIGAVQNDPAAGEPADICAIGVGKVQAQANVAFGDWLTSDTTGRAKATTSASDIILGQALEAASAAGDIVQYRSANFRY